uniref:hypothetical protein n=1 Tax=Terasakiella pusilla TaxID=64973 RepID=UPI003AA9B732
MKGFFVSYGQYLTRRSGVLYFRRVINVSALAGSVRLKTGKKTEKKVLIEIRKSLKTSQVVIAKDRIRRINFLIDELMHQIITAHKRVIDTPDKLLSIRRTICAAVDQLLCGQVEIWELERALAGPRTVEQAQAAAVGKQTTLQKVTGEIITNNFQRVEEIVEAAINSLKITEVDNSVIKKIAGREARWIHISSAILKIFNECLGRRPESEA